MGPVFDAAFHHVQRWLNDGIAPPITPRITFDGDPPEIVRDEHGIAMSGIRLPQAEVPLAQNSSIPLKGDDLSARLGGSSHLFSKGKILELYGDRDTFLSKFEDATSAAVTAGVIMPREAPDLLAEAGETWDELIG